MPTLRTALATTTIAFALLTAVALGPVAPSAAHAGQNTLTVVHAARARAVALAEPLVNAPRPRSHRRSKAIMPLRRSAGLAPGTTSAPMTYHGGRLMTAPAHVYLLWYGDWSTSSAPALLGDLLGGLGGSAYARTNSTFTDRAGHHVTSDITLAGSTKVVAAHGARLSDAGVRRQVASAIAHGTLPSDPDGIYVVATSADVRETSGFGTRYCGWHSHSSLKGVDLKYLFVGDPTLQAQRTCAPPGSSTPNGDRGADAMASTVLHEIDETLTDPDLDGWYDRYYNENGDKCAWTYGATYRSATGAPANVDFSGHDFLVQRNWVVSPRQGCAMRA
jgi:hypothetical protein